MSHQQRLNAHEQKVKAYDNKILFTGFSLVSLLHNQTQKKSSSTQNTNQTPKYN
jgi:hypothetical protein